MTKRATLNKQSVKKSATTSSGRVTLVGTRRDALAPSPAALEKIKRLETSSQRAEQRLGQFRLA